MIRRVGPLAVEALELVAMGASIEGVCKYECELYVCGLIIKLRTCL